MSARPYFERLRSIFSSEKATLDALDAAIGDGDHGTTMLRGLTAADRAEDGRQAKAFMRASGGASGTLFGLLFYEIESWLEDSGETLETHLRRALDRIRDLGAAEPGDKSMVDALSPAVSALHRVNGLEAALVAAEKGRDATRAMRARRGRARYVEQAGEGHIDPGATSVCHILEALGGENR